MAGGPGTSQTDQVGCPTLGLGGWVLGFSLGFFSMKISVTLWFLILTVICFGLYALFPKHPWYLFLLGWAMLDCAYLIVLRRSYRKKTAIFTRGGLLEYEKSPLLYKSVYLLLSFIGVMIALALIVDLIFY